MKQKVYFLKKEHIETVDDTDYPTLKSVFNKGYSFIKFSGRYYSLHTNEKHNTLEMTLVGVKEIS